jgi:L-amino acid N-acyltransferase YncA
VRGFNTHPAHRNFSVLRELFKAVGDVVDAEGISEIRSNVYKTNRLSMAFHRKLGFQITNENAKGVEFFATVSGLMANPTFQRTATRPLN